MNAIWIMYLQYWETPNAKATFDGYLAILKESFCHPKLRCGHTWLQISLWRLVQKSLEFLKLVEIITVIVISNMEDNGC
jgi:hypothetical protein